MVNNSNWPKIWFGAHKSVFGDLDLKDSKAAVEVWIREIGENAGYRTESTIYSDNRTLVQDLLTGKINFGCTTSREYLRIKEKMDIELLFANLHQRKATKKSLLLVRSDYSYSGIEDLRNQRLAIKRGDDLGLLFLNTYLLRNNLEEADSFFSIIEESRKVSQAIFRLFFGQADACICNDTVLNNMLELNPQIGKRLKIIASSPELINDVAFIRNDMDAEIKEKIIHSALNIIKTSRGRQLMTLIKADGPVLIDDSDLNNLRQLLKEYEELKNKK